MKMEDFLPLLPEIGHSFMPDKFWALVVASLRTSSLVFLLVAMRICAIQFAQLSILRRE